MINLLIGVSGSGKSYEANVYHILFWLQKGRRVITNLPVNVDAYAAIDPAFRELLVVRTKPQPIRGRWEPTREEGAFVVEDDETEWQQPAPGARAFAGVWDYYDTWRHPEQGFGAIFVLDEAQYFIPRKDASQEVVEWYALHRHFNQDGLLLTQSYGKLSADVVGNVQMVYRVRKNVALGSSASYTRKVQDGVRGEVVNTTIRRYDAKHFKLYRSHTQGGAAAEFNATDVRPLWKHWSFMGAAACLLFVVGMLVTGGVDADPMKAGRTNIQAHAKVKPAQPPAAASPKPAAAVPSVAAPMAQAASQVVAPPDPNPEPYAEKQLHLVGVIRNAHKVVWSFVLSQNGQPVAYLSDADLLAAGYEWNPKHDCAGVIVWNGKGRPVLCDLPSISLTPAVGTSKG